MFWRLVFSFSDLFAPLVGPTLLTSDRPSHSRENNKLRLLMVVQKWPRGPPPRSLAREQKQFPVEI